VLPKNFQRRKTRKTRKHANTQTTQTPENVEPWALVRILEPTRREKVHLVHFPKVGRAKHSCNHYQRSNLWRCRHDWRWTAITGFMNPGQTQQHFCAMVCLITWRCRRRRSAKTERRAAQRSTYNNYPPYKMRQRSLIRDFQCIGHSLSSDPLPSGRYNSKGCRARRQQQLQSLYSTRSSSSVFEVNRSNRTN